MSNVANFVSDNTEQLFIGHNIHQRREYTNTTISTSKGVYVDNIINFEVQRNAFNVGQSCRKLLQTNGVGVIVGANLIVFVHPIDVFLDVIYHVGITQSNCFHSFCCTADSLFKIKLSHCRHCAQHADSCNKNAR